MHRFAHAIFALTVPAIMIAPTASAASFSARDLATEEGKFAAWSVKHGMRDAFVEFFADDSILLRPDIVNGREFMRARTNPPIVLDWRTTLSVMSASGDLGMSTGPWINTSKADPKAPASYGQFFSVWQKQKSGEWKVLVDHGISHEKPPVDLPLAAHDLAATAASSPPSFDAEKWFAERGNAVGAQVAYREVIDERSRLLRPDRLPMDGTARISEYLNSLSGKWTWTTQRQGTSNAGDLSWSIGTYAWQSSAGASEAGHFIRVWVRDAKELSARWKIAGEILTPRPPPAKS
ncbi:MAG: nuclear transport factor 2 family protein [Betaproteobacteria bacterium]|nr:nuclear transport factor 2 family protein [Betaproteobacteria bacterium]